MGHSNAHFSLVWLYQNFDGVMARLARSGVTSFTLTHRGQDVGKIDLAAVKPAGAVSQLPSPYPAAGDYPDYPNAPPQLPRAAPVLDDDELDELDHETRESIKAWRAEATAP